VFLTVSPILGLRESSVLTHQPFQLRLRTNLARKFFDDASCHSDPWQHLEEFTWKRSFNQGLSEQCNLTTIQQLVDSRSVLLVCVKCSTTVATFPL
jgi:hypothetical protein